MRLTQSIAFRLFLIIVTAQVLVLGALTFGTVSIQHSHLMEHVQLSAERVSAVIARSTRYSMLTNRKEDVQQIVASVGGEPGIEGIRIYDKSGTVIFGTIDADIHQRVDMTAEACVSCHADDHLEPPQPPGDKLSRIFSKPGGGRVLGLITPIRNEPQCSTADCHAHPPSKTILGVLDVKMSLASVDARLTESRNNLLVLSAFAALLVALASGCFIWIVLNRPVKRLKAGMDLVAAGSLDHRIDVRSQNELGQLATSFNKMSGDLEIARKEITDWSLTLEERVKQKTADLEQAHRQLIMAEKMASLGNLASSVAHEINNPLEGILTFAKLLIKKIKKSALKPEEQQVYCEELQLVADEAQRCGGIVKNLLVFSRQSGGKFQQTRLYTLVQRCIMLLGHHAKMRNVRLHSECIEDDTVECDANQIQQALLAIMVNAIEAIGSKHGVEGVVSVMVEDTPSKKNITLRVSDNGSGMSDEVKAHIFEPFFTTKSEGKGVGLGLSIVYGIVERHNGRIRVDSMPGAGTTFAITLPRLQNHHDLEQSTITEGNRS